MKLWPDKSFVIVSQSDASQLTAALMQHTEKNASGYYWYRRDGISFSGEVNSKGFSVIKTVPYWNLSPVKIEGEFMLEENPLVIKVRMYNSFTLPVIIMVALVSTGLVYNYSDDPPWLIIIGMAMAFYLLLNIPFQIEAARAKQILLEITEGKIIEKNKPD